MNLTIDIFQNHFKAVFSELSFITAIIIILVYGVMYNPSTKHRYPILTKVIGWLAVQTLMLALMLTVNGWDIIGSTITNTLVFNNILILDDFTLIIKCIIILSALTTIFISFDYIKEQKINAFEYIILILFSTLSMLLIVSSYDLISMYLAIEFQSLSSYVIAAFQRNNEFSVEAGLKYFILGALSSGLLLFGESILYGLTGTTNFEELTKLFTFFSSFSFTIEDSGVYLENQSLVINAITMGLLLILIAFLFKISAVPFHMWAPDVYEGAPTSVTAFFAITPKIAILSLLLRLCLYTFYDLIDLWQQIIIISAFLSMFIGTLGAINQKKIKRLLAYSSIAHVGYLLMGLATSTIEAIESLLVYIIVYIIMVICSFSIILSLSKENYHSFNLMPSFISFKTNIQNNKTSSNINSVSTSSISSFPIDNVNTTYFIGLNSFFIYKPYFNYKSIVDSVNLHSNNLVNTILPQNNTTNWEQTYLKAGQPLWNPYKFLSFNFSTVNNYNKLNLISSKAPNLFIKKKNEFIKSITDLSSLSKTNPILAITFTIVLFSNAGIPPLAGFFGKLNIFLSAIEAHMYFLAISGILCSTMGAFYSIRLIKIIYFHKINQRIWHKYKPISKESSLILGITFFFILFFFFNPSSSFIITHSAALSLCLQYIIFFFYDYVGFYIYFVLFYLYFFFT